VLGDNVTGSTGSFVTNSRLWGWSSFSRSIRVKSPDGATGDAGAETHAVQVVADAPAAPNLLLSSSPAQKAVKWGPAVPGKRRWTDGHNAGLVRVYLPGALDRGAHTLEEVWLVVDWAGGRGGGLPLLLGTSAP